MTRIKNQKDYSLQQEAIEASRQKLISDPANGKLHFEYGQMEFNQGNYFLALAEFKTAEVLGFISEELITQRKKCIALLPDLLAINHNQYFRFKSLEQELLKRIEESGRTDLENITVLDVGGGDGTFSAFIPQIKYSLAEPLKNGINGKNLPFEDNSFDYVVSCHVLEHVPIEQRELFLETLLSKCKVGVILLNPVYIPETLPEERLELYVELTDEEWAKEHIDCILPTIDSIKKFADRKNIFFAYQPNGNITTTLSYAYLEFFTRNDSKKKAKFTKINKFFNSYNLDFLNSETIPTAGLFYLGKSK